MAPIKPKPQNEKSTQPPALSMSSGYSTGSYSSTSSSCTNSTDDQLIHPRPLIIPPLLTKSNDADESTVYVNMQRPIVVVDKDRCDTTERLPSPFHHHNDFNSNLYENLLTMKAAQELERPTNGLSTSTPTESPLLPSQTQSGFPLTPTTPQANELSLEQSEDYYQTPRKSIISVDDKIPSYYPNSCETVKTRRSSQSSSVQLRSSEKTTPSNASRSSEKTTPTNTNGTTLRRFNSLNKRYSIAALEQKQQELHGASTSSSTSSSSNARTEMHKKPENANKKTGAAAAAAHRISRNIYGVVQRSTGNADRKASKLNMESNDVKDKLHCEILQMAMLQNIDFKFDDRQEENMDVAQIGSCNRNIKPLKVIENILQYNSTNATDHKTQIENSGSIVKRVILEPCVMKSHKTNIPENFHNTISPLHALNVHNPVSEDKSAMTQSKLEVPVTGGNGSVYLHCSNSMKKFTSLPRFKKIDFSPIRLRINNVLQRSNASNNGQN